MKSVRETVLSKLDNTVRWTGMPARVADEMSHAATADRKHRPSRWIPILPIAFSCALFILSLIWPPVLGLLSPGVVIALIAAQMGIIMALVPAIHASGPLGRASIEDDEREAALRKDSFLFCLGVLAALNGLGQPVLLILSHWQNWHLGQSASVTLAALTLNAALFGSLPTLYASWNLRQLPKE